MPDAPLINCISYSASKEAVQMIISSLTLHWSMLMSVTLTSRGEALLPLAAIGQWGGDPHAPHTGSRPSLPPWPPGSPASGPTQDALQETWSVQNVSISYTLCLTREHLCVSIFIILASYCACFHSNVSIPTSVPIINENIYYKRYELLDTLKPIKKNTFDSRAIKAFNHTFYFIWLQI